MVGIQVSCLGVMPIPDRHENFSDRNVTLTMGFLIDVSSDTVKGQLPVDISFLRQATMLERIIGVVICADFI